MNKMIQNYLTISCLLSLLLCLSEVKSSLSAAPIPLVKAIVVQETEREFLRWNGQSEESFSSPQSQFKMFNSTLMLGNSVENSQ